MNQDQLQQMKTMGGITGLMDKLPGMGGMNQQVQEKLDNKAFFKMEAIIDSMTLAERATPDIINGSRKRRIASGSGTQIQDINSLIKQHKQMSKMMKKVSKKGGMAKLMRGLGGMKGQMPGGDMLPPGGGKKFQF